MMTFRTLALAGLLLTTPLAADDTETWIHVRVEDAHHDEQVSINVPVSLARAAARAFEGSTIQGDIQIEFDDEGLSLEELRDLWEEVRDAPNATLVTVETRDENVVVRKDGEWLLVEATENRGRGSQVDVRVPMSVVEALLADPEHLDLEGAIVALAEATRGPVVSVRDGDERVEIWIDERSDSERAEAGR